MITREQYLAALDIVEAYHRQIKSEIQAVTIDEESVDVGDYIVFSQLSGNMKHLTIGKPYKIVRMWKWGSGAPSIFIIGDNGKKKPAYDYRHCEHTFVKAGTVKDEQ